MQTGTMYIAGAAFATLTVMVFILSGCNAEPKIDGSSEQAMNHSIEMIKSDLPPEEKARFEEAIVAIGLEAIDFPSLAMDPEAGAETVVRHMRERLNGKTFDEVIEMAERIIRERQDNE